MLADDILAAMGTDKDFAGCFKLVVNSIQKCQRFVISDEVVEAAKQLLNGRPSTLVNSLPLCRLPYQDMWLEWNGEHALGLNPNAPLRPDAHKVKRMGCWIASGDGGRIGAAFWIWQDPEGDIAFGGYGTAFAFEHDISGVYRMFGTTMPETTIENVRQSLSSTSWSKFARSSDDEAAAIVRLCHQAAPFPNPWMGPFYDKMIERGIRLDHPDVLALQESWDHDISGEASFLFAVLMMLNSKNAVEQQPVDLYRLNKARAKNGKPPKFNYSVTRLSISRGQNRIGIARGMDQHAMRQHLVRGHFKIRRTGVYWWSPFVRGDASRPMERHHYDLKE